LTSGKRHCQLRFNFRVKQKKLVNFDPLAPEITRLIFSDPKSTALFLCMLMHLSLGHVTLLPGEFQSSESPPIGLMAHWVLPQISSFVFCASWHDQLIDWLIDAVLVGTVRSVVPGAT